VEQPDENIHQPVRLKLMAALKALPERERMEFTRAKHLVQATDGNLGAHITRLEQAGYIGVEKDFLGKRPRTRLHLTKAGRRAFDKYADFLKALLESTGHRAV
jgi:DNA-binding MarR family transcriptional regulator